MMTALYVIGGIAVVWLLIGVIRAMFSDNESFMDFIIDMMMFDILLELLVVIAEALADSLD